MNFDPIATSSILDGFAHVLPDLPGYGRSPWPAEDAADSLDRSADHLAAWLAGHPAAVLVGHSLGGVLATLVGERVPSNVRGIIDLDGNLTRGDCTFSADAARYSLRDFVRHGFDDLRDAIYRRGIEDPALRRYHAALSAASPTVCYRQAVELLALSTTETLAGRLARLPVPTLFLAGVPGGICEHSRDLLDREGVRWIGIEPAGHWLHLDAPDEVASAIAAFVREL